MSYHKFEFLVDEYTFQVDDPWVCIYDGEQSLRLMIPVDVWDEVIKEYGRKKNERR